MSVEFDEQQNIGPSISPSSPINGRTINPSAPKGMVGWLLRKGIIKTEFQGTIILLAVIVVMLALTGFIFFTYILNLL